MSHLAINGGKKLRTKYFPSQFSFKADKKMYLKEIEKILDGGILSAYRGNSSPNFWGGKYVQEFENQFSEKFKTKALAVNSCTSALWVACAAIDLKPGDEVIVTPWSMSCSATVPLLFGAIPVFADIESKTFCLDPESIKKNITKKTRAIIVVDLFGGLANWEEILNIAEEHNLFIIEDAAQAIGAYKSVGIKAEKKYAGTFGDIGCFSFTQGKHLTSGEGGIICTNDYALYKRCSMLRNHAEAVVSDAPDVNIDHSEFIGLNLRMTEIQAAIMIKQLNGLDAEIIKRRNHVRAIETDLSDTLFIQTMFNDCIHSYYVLPFLFRENKEIHRNKFIDAVRAELSEEEGRPDRGILLSSGYITPLYLIPLFQKKKHWAFQFTEREYGKGMCPVCEDLQNNKFFLTLYHGLNMSRKDITDFCNAFFKVCRYLKELK